MWFGVGFVEAGWDLRAFLSLCLALRLERRSCFRTVSASAIARVSSTSPSSSLRWRSVSASSRRLSFVERGFAWWCLPWMGLIGCLLRLYPWGQC